MNKNSIKNKNVAPKAAKSVSNPRPPPAQSKNSPKGPSTSDVQRAVTQLSDRVDELTRKPRRNGQKSLGPNHVAVFSDHLHKEKEKHLKIKSKKKKRVPVGGYAACVIDPMAYAPMRIPDRDTRASGIITIRGITPISFSPVGSAQTPSAHFGFIILGAGVKSDSVQAVTNLSPCFPPNIPATEGTPFMQVGVTNNDGLPINVDNIFANEAVIDVGPASLYTGQFNNWRMISAAMKVINSSTMLYKTGDVYAFTTGSGRPDVLLSDISLAQLATFTTNTKQYPLASTSPYVVWYPNNVSSLDYIPTDLLLSTTYVADETPGYIGLAFYFAQATMPEGTEIHVQWEVSLEVTPRSNALSVMPTAPSWANSREMDNASNLFATNMQIHAKGGDEGMARFREPSGKHSRLLTSDASKRYGVHVSTPDVTAVSVDASETSSSGVMGAINGVLSTVKKYTPVVESVLGALGAFI